MLRVGLTGPTGSGKSSVSAVLRDMGLPVIDADKVAHELYVPGSPTVAELARAFGDAVLTPEGGVDRARLGAAVFGDAEKLALLERIVHPLLLAELERRLAALESAGAPLAVVEAALLLKWGPPAFIDLVVGVTADRELRRERLAASGLDPAVVTARLDAQMGEEVLRRGSDMLVENEGSREALRAAAERLAGDLKRRAAGI